jgi:ATP-binding cassette subfamily F protein 3
VILEKIKLNLVPGSRIGLLGRNGAGKSTFIKPLSPACCRCQGKLEVAPGVKIGYFAQHQLEALRPDDTPLHLAAARPATKPSRSCATFWAASASR